MNIPGRARAPGEKVEDDGPGVVGAPANADELSSGLKVSIILTT